MISANNVSLRFGKKALFEDVNIKFTEGNCYGIIGANGAGKSTFLKILSGELETTTGDIVITPGQRLSVLEQDHFKYDSYSVMDTVILGNPRLYEIMKEKDAIYAKEDFSDEDGIRASELEAEFAELDGWEAESNAANLLNGLGIETELHYAQMSELGGNEKVKILSGELETTTGDIVITPGQRLSVLEQDHFKYDQYSVMDTVILGNPRLYEIMKEKDAIYAKEDFSDEDGIRASELEAEFAELDGWEAESNAANLLNGLGIETELHYSQMSELGGNEKVKVLLAKALFGNPDILLLDEPTNHLDLDAIAWLEEFLINFENTVIVVSHDRHFLNKVCTQTADIDYGKIQLYAGNYDFWFESSQLLVKQMKEANKKKEEKIKELQEFINRFSANASKSKQATSRKRALEKIELEEIKPSSRKYPYIDFRPDREIGNEVLQVEGISKTINGEKVLDNISFILRREDKVAFVGSNEIATTTLFQILAGEMEPDEGTYKWGVTTSQAYFPKDNTEEFKSDDIITDWLMGYSPVKDITYVRGFLGRMLFSQDDALKKVKVLSGGEKVRCMLSKMMISGANCLILDEPTNHLDMESIQALNNGLIRFSGVELFSCHDHQFIETTANRIMEIMPGGKLIDKITTYDDYLASDEMARKRTIYIAKKEDDEN